MVNHITLETPDMRGEKTGSGSGLKVVVLSDDPTRVATVVRLLTHRFGVEVVQSVEECRRTINSNQPALIVEDILEKSKLPLGGGDEFAEQLKAIPILILVGEISTRQRITRHFVRHGACVVTPIDEKGLLGFVQSLLVRSSATVADGATDPLESIFRHVARHYEPFIRGVVSFNIGKRRIDPDEIVDDVLLLLNSSLPAFVRYDQNSASFQLDSMESELKSWLAVSTRQMCKNPNRAERRNVKKLTALRSAMFGTKAGASQRDVSSEIEARDAADYLLRDLPSIEQEVLVERHALEMDYESIGRNHRKSASWARTMVRKAQKDARERLAEDWWK